MRFEALEQSIEMIRQLRRPVARLKTRDPKLTRQIREAASSVALNIGEGSRRRGQDKVHFFRVASGSAEEVRTALRVAEAWGDLDEASVRPAFGTIDRVLRLLYGLTR